MLVLTGGVVKAPLEGLPTIWLIGLVYTVSQTKSRTGHWVLERSGHSNSYEKNALCSDVSYGWLLSQVGVSDNGTEWTGEAASGRLNASLGP